jgi:transposase
MKFKAYSQDQLDLFPVDVYSEIPENDICRFINEIVNELNITELEAIYTEEGNIAYHPRMMLKVFFYSYYNGIFSSRKIAKEIERNIFYWFLSARQRPDFRTIANFRKRHIGQLKGLFNQIVEISLSLGIAKMRKIAIDGTKIKANAGRDKFRDNDWLQKKAKEENDAIEKAFKRMDEIDDEEDRTFGYDKRGDELPENLNDPEERIRKIRELQKEMEKRNKKRINETDKDCGLMKTRQGFQAAYNCQTVVDTESQIILTQEVINNANDSGQIRNNMEELKGETGLKPEILLADAGYLDGEDIQYLDKEGITGLIADKELNEIRKSRDGIVDEDSRFKKDQFKYDPEKDEYICPEGRKLIRESRNRQKAKRKSGIEIEYVQYRCRECKLCENQKICCRSKIGRKITRYADEKLREKMYDLIRSDWGYEEYKSRMCTIEPAFGNIKQNKGFREFHLRGLINVKGEYSLMAIAHNLEKMYKKMGRYPIKNANISKTKIAMKYIYLFLYYKGMISNFSTGL